MLSQALLLYTLLYIFPDADVLDRNAKKVDS